MGMNPTRQDLQTWKINKLSSLLVPGVGGGAEPLSHLGIQRLREAEVQERRQKASASNKERPSQKKE